jgi:hypothetical protein
VTPERAEAAAIEWAAGALLGGSTVSAVMREWNRRGLRTPQGGKPFTRQSVTTILRNPRLAGLNAYHGEITGPGDWQPVLAEETWRAVRALLDDPARLRLRPRGRLPAERTPAGPPTPAVPRRAHLRRLAALLRARCGMSPFFGRDYDDDGNPVPDGEDIDGAGLLDDVAAFLRAYVASPASHAAVAVTLWAAHTHLSARFESAPRLALLSPEKQCGKSRVLELLDLLCAGAETLSDASPAYCRRWHHHGNGYGHRVAHCHSQASPYSDTGYTLTRPP